jgi:hypothetical protein
VNWHQIIDERNLEMDRVIADLLRFSPENLHIARRWICSKLDDPCYSEQGKDALREWLNVMDAEGLSGVLRVLQDESDEGDRLRQSSPFAYLMPQEERMRILKKYEPLRVRTHPAGI